MSITLTRKKIAAIVGTLLVIAVMLEGAVFNAAWHTLSILSRGRDATPGCDCVVSAGGLSGLDLGILGIAGLFAGGLAIGAGYLIMTIIRTRRFVEATNNRCEIFTFGYFSPKIAMCDHCVAVLPPGELQAILTHEGHHVIRRDPLKFLIVDTIKYIFFLMPLFATLAMLYRTSAELEADEQVQSQDALGSVLLRWTDRMSPYAVAPFASIVSMRIERLLISGWHMRWNLSGATVMVSGLVVMVAGWVVFHDSALPYAASVCGAIKACMPAAPLDVLPRIYYTGAL